MKYFTMFRIKNFNCTLLFLTPRHNFKNDQWNPFLSIRHKCVPQREICTMSRILRPFLFFAGTTKATFSFCVFDTKWMTCCVWFCLPDFIAFFGIDTRCEWPREVFMACFWGRRWFGCPPPDEFIPDLGKPLEFRGGWDLGKNMELFCVTLHFD